MENANVATSTARIEHLVRLIAAAALVVAGFILISNALGSSDSGRVHLGSEYDTYRSIEDVAQDSDMIVEAEITADLGTRVDSGDDSEKEAGLVMRFYEATVAKSFSEAGPAPGETITLVGLDAESYLDDGFTPFRVGDNLGLLLERLDGVRDAPGLLAEGEVVFVPIAANAGVSDVLESGDWQARSASIVSTKRSSSEDRAEESDASVFLRFNPVDALE